MDKKDKSSKKLFEGLRAKRELTKYEMANYLGMLPQSYYYLEEKAQGCSFEVLSSVRAKSGLSWNQFGIMIDEEVKINQASKDK